MITLLVIVTMKIKFKISLGYFSVYTMVLGICCHYHYLFCFVIFLGELPIEVKHQSHKVGPVAVEKNHIAVFFG